MPARPLARQESQRTSNLTIAELAELYDQHPLDKVSSLIPGSAFARQVADQQKPLFYGLFGQVVDRSFRTFKKSSSMLCREQLRFQFWGYIYSLQNGQLRLRRACQSVCHQARL